MVSETRDATAEFYKGKDTGDFHVWCVSENIDFKCTLHEANDRTSLTYVFKQGDLTTGLIHDVVAKNGYITIPQRVIKMICSNKEMIRNMFKVQHNFKYCDMPYPPLIIEAQNKIEWLRMLGIHESRFREDPLGLLKLYISHGHVLPEESKPQSYRQAFMFADVCDVRASLSPPSVSKYGTVSNSTLDLVTSDKQLRFVHYKYNAREMLSLIKVPLMLDDDILNQVTVTQTFVQEIRKAFQLEQAARIYQDAPKLKNVDSKIFMVDDTPATGV